MIHSTGWLELIAPLMPHEVRARRGLNPGGRKPEMSMQALLTACLLLAMMERPLIIRDIQRLLDKGIDAATKKHLGLDPSRAITERMVSKHFGILAGLVNGSTHFESNAWLFEIDKVRKYLGLTEDQLLDPYEHAFFIDKALKENANRLQDVIRLGLRGTLPTDSEHDGDFAIDGTYIHSWEKEKSKRRALHFPTPTTGEEIARDPDIKPTQKEKGASKRAGVTKIRRPAKPHLHPDPDATWWNKGTPPHSDSGLGFLMSALTWVEKDLGPNQQGPDIPYMIEHFALKTASCNGAIEGANLVEALVAIHEKEDETANKPDRTRGDILCDREYSMKDYWLKRMHIAGFTPRDRSNGSGCGSHRRPPIFTGHPSTPSKRPRSADVRNP